MSDESKDVEDEVADRGKFINTTRTTMYSHPCLERTKQKLLGISLIEEFLMILSGIFKMILTVLRIRDVYPGSRIRLCPYQIPDPIFFHPGSRIRIKEFEYFDTKIVFKLSEI